MMIPRNRQGCRFTSRVLWAIVIVLLCGTTGGFAAPAASPGSAPSLQQLFKQSAPAVVLITQLNAAGKWTSLGSGFVVSSTGVIVTNHHVIAPDAGAVKLTINLPRGDVYTDVRIIYAEARRDFAVLSIKAAGLPTIRIGNSDTVEVGDQVVAIGNPQGLELTFTSGIVGSVRLDPSNGYRFIQHQAPISHGSSGGPLLNMQGEVIGINTFSFTEGQNLNGAVPINYVKPYFGDSAGMSWERFANVPAAVPPPHTSSSAAPPTPPPPPVAGGSSPSTFFGTMSFYRPQDDSFKNGFSAGVYDMVTLFAATAENSGKIDSQEALTLFRCLDGKGDKLNQLRDWIDSVTTESATESSIVVVAVARACQTSFGPGKFLFFEHKIADYRDSADKYKLGFAAGVYDTVSLYAAVATGSEGIDHDKALAFYRCLDRIGEKLGELRAWVDSTVSQDSPERPVVSAVLSACQK